jgi:hypothetical protein
MNASNPSEPHSEPSPEVQKFLHDPLEKLARIAEVHAEISSFIHKHAGLFTEMKMAVFFGLHASVADSEADSSIIIFNGNLKNAEALRLAREIGGEWTREEKPERVDYETQIGHLKVNILGADPAPQPTRSVLTL